MSNDDRAPGCRIGRRQFLAGCAGLAAMAALPGRRVLAAVGTEGLRIQRLAWAGIRLQLPRATLFIDPLVNPDAWGTALKDPLIPVRSEEHTSEIQSLMRISYAVFCLKKKTT